MLFALCTNLSATEDTEYELQGWRFALEQDLFYLLDPDKNEDRDYTIGIDVGLFGESATHSYIYNALNGIDHLLGLQTTYDTHIQRSTHLGVAVYTPDDLANPDPIYDDRPYASLLYWSNRTDRIATHGNYGLSSELTIGILGLEFAKVVQKLTHKLQREITNSETPADPQGWNNQISDGGEPTFRYRFEYKHLLQQSTWYDISANLAAQLGYQTDISAGLLCRIGTRVSHFAYFEPRIGQEISYHADRMQQDNYLYLSYQLTGVVYNELLQGGFRDSKVTISADQIERAVHSLALGWTMTLESGTRLTFAQYMHTPEFKGPNARKHYWGGFYLTFPFAGHQE